MIDKYLKIMVLLLSFIQSSHSQVIIKGYVKDTLGNPLPFANVFTQEQNQTIIAFSTTDEKGFFVFESNFFDTLIVKATLLSYMPQEYVFTKQNKVPPLIEFHLYPQSLVLKEAVILGNNRIIEKSDTVTFKADAYRDSTERNLEELLKKIPGIEVDKSGIITVKGQPIKKILIEGDDLTGHNYQLMSKNLAADVVDKIQVIDKFNNNKVLKGLRRSEDKAINITLKENRKNLLFGHLNLGLGNDERTNNSMNLFTFIKKFKSITFGSFNTIGLESTADRILSEDFKEESETRRLKAIVTDQNSPLINIDRTPSVQVGSQHVRFNKSSLLSTHFVTRINKNTKIIGSLTIANDNNRIHTENYYQYLLKDSIFRLNELNEFNRKPMILESHLNIETDLGKKTLLQNSSIFRKYSTSNNVFINSNANGISNILNDKSAFFSNILDLTHRISDDKAILTNIQISYEERNQSLKISQNSLRLLPFKNTFSNNMQQQYNKPLTFISLNSQFYTVQKKNQFSLGLCGVNRNETLSSHLQANLDSIPVILSDSFYNSLIFKQQNLFGYLNTKTEIRGVQLWGDISSGFYRVQQEYTPSVQREKKGFYALPTIGFRKEIDKKAYYGTYAYNFNLPQVADLTKGLVMTDYRTLQRGASIVIPSNNHTIIAGYAYGNFSDNFMINSSLIAIQTAKGYRSAFLIDRDFNITENIENTFKNQNIIFSTGIDCYFPNIYMRLKLRPNISYSSYQNALNSSDVRETKNFSKSVTLSFRSAFLKTFNFHLGGTLTQNRINTCFGEKKLNNKNLSLGSFLDLNFRFSNRLNTKFESEYFYSTQENLSSQYYSFFNASADYEVIRSKFSLIFTARNIFNTQNLVNIFANDYLIYSNKVKLLPRYFLIEGNFKF